MRTYNKRMDGSKIILAGHRGDRTYYPENTMPAFKYAVELGCDMLETDLHMTKDGHLVLIHDTDVKRTTDGSGSVNEMTLEEVRKLDAGSWKDPKFAGTKVPTLEEFLEFVSKTDLTVNWELKDYPMDVGDDLAFEAADKLIEMIERYGMREKSMIDSFSARTLVYIADKYPGKYVLHGQGINKCDASNDVPEKAPETIYDWVCMYNKTPETPAGLAEDYEYAIKHDIIPCICFPDDEENYKLAIQLGCRMFTSDNPAKGIEILKKLGER